MAATLASQTEMWMKKLNIELRAILNANNLVGTDLISEDGRVKVGKSITINRPDGAVVTDYDPAGNAFPVVTDSEITFTYDQDKWVAFAVENAEEFFANAKYSDEQKNDLVYKIAASFDKWVFTKYTTEADIVIDDGASGYLAVSATNIKEFWGGINTAFNKANIPENMRSVAIPYWMDTLTRDLDIANKVEGMGQAFVAQVYGIKVFMSNNIYEPTTGNFEMVGGYDGAFQGAMAYTKPWMGGLEGTGHDKEAGFIHAIYGGAGAKPEAMMVAKVKEA